MLVHMRHQWIHSSVEQVYYKKKLTKHEEATCSNSTISCETITLQTENLSMIKPQGWQTSQVVVSKWVLTCLNSELEHLRTLSIAEQDPTQVKHGITGIPSFNCIQSSRLQVW